MTPEDLQVATHGYVAPTAPKYTSVVPDSPLYTQEFISTGQRSLDLMAPLQKGSRVAWIGHDAGGRYSKNKLVVETANRFLQEDGQNKVVHISLDGDTRHQVDPVVGRSVRVQASYNDPWLSRLVLPYLATQLARQQSNTLVVFSGVEVMVEAHDLLSTQGGYCKATCSLPQLLDSPRDETTSIYTLNSLPGGGDTTPEQVLFKRWEEELRQGVDTEVLFKPESRLIKVKGQEVNNLYPAFPLAEPFRSSLLQLKIARSKQRVASRSMKIALEVNLGEENIDFDQRLVAEELDKVEGYLLTVDERSSFDVHDQEQAMKVLLVLQVLVNGDAALKGRLLLRFASLVDLEQALYDYCLTDHYAVVDALMMSVVKQEKFVLKNANDIIRGMLE